MYKNLILCAGLLLASRVASAQFVERQQPVEPDSTYVPVNLNQLANHRGSLEAPSTRVSLQAIPLELAQSGQSNNLFLEKAGWPDWAKDPLDFYADYDNVPKEPTDTLPVVQIPTDDYSAVYVLATCENDAKYSNILSLRIGVKRGPAQTTYHDYEFTVPRANESSGPNVVKTLTGTNGNIFLLRLPLHAAFLQEFFGHRVLDVEITKKIRLAVSKPDAARFQYRPLGLPSGVHLYGMTFERAPVRFHMQGAQVGNVFNEPETPSFTINLEPVEYGLKNLTIRAKAIDYYGKEIEFPAEDMSIGPLAHFSEFRRTFSLPVPRRGYYALTVDVKSEGKLLVTKHTTFALLPKDTRAHRATSPFGTWDFGGTHYTPSDSAIVGPLYVKAGLRYGMFPFTKAERERYGVLKGNDPTVRSSADLTRLDEAIAEMKKSGEIPQRWMLFHEDVISGNHVTRTPDLFTGKQYALNADEKKKFDEMVNTIRVAAPKIRRAFPGIKIYLGNGVPHLMEEFLRQKLPTEMFDVLGNEAASFQRLPESQPTDFVANNPSLWMEQELLKQYGYDNKKVEQAYEVIYPSSNPGNLSLRHQANYMVRNIMHSLAWGVPAIRFGCIADVGSSYYFSNWGASGLMFGRPNLSPKPVYVAIATMTQLLDGAKFSRIVPTGSTTVYAFEFKKPKDGFITCLWTSNAPQHIELQVAQKELVVTNLMFNQQSVPVRRAKANLLATSDPVFIESARPLKAQAGATVENGLPQEQHTIISALDDATQWQIVNGEDGELESYNFMQPRRAGNFTVQSRTDFAGQLKVLEVRPASNDETQWWLPRYTQIKAKTPLTIAGTPTHIGLLINGNGGWGRIIFELEDAAGQRWISLGTEQSGQPTPWLADWMSKEEFAKLKSAGISDWNSNDVWGHSVINFSGWRYLQFPLPGNYPGEGYHWPYTSQWRCLKTDGTTGDYIVHYPLKVTKLAVTSRAKVLYGTTVMAVQRPEIYLKDLSVTYGDPDKVFWKPEQ